MPKLGVNVDHVATLREARKIEEPDPIHAAIMAESAQADSIVVHLREDRRHIKERDVRLLRKIIKIKLNLEMSINREIVDIARDLKPDQATLVPEKREEITTEGGLDVVSNFEEIKKVVDLLRSSDIIVSLFIDPELRQIKAAKKIEADAVELHTGNYANSKTEEEKSLYLKELKDASKAASRYGLIVHAGHGLNYQNVREIANILQLEELNIGHSIISRAVFVGLEIAIREMKALIET